MACLKSIARARLSQAELRLTIASAAFEASIQTYHEAQARFLASVRELQVAHTRNIAALAAWQAARETYQADDVIGEMARLEVERACEACIDETVDVDLEDLF